MKYWELKPGDWFYFNSKPYIKVEEMNGFVYGISLDSMSFGEVANFIKPEDEVSFCSTLDYIYPSLHKCGTDVRTTEIDVLPLKSTYVPLSRIWENEIIVKYKFRFWQYAVIYGNEFQQGKAFALSNLKAEDFYRYTEFHRTFPENT